MLVLTKEWRRWCQTNLLSHDIRINSTDAGLSIVNETNNLGEGGGGGKDEEEEEEDGV